MLQRPAIAVALAHQEVETLGGEWHKIESGGGGHGAGRQLRVGMACADRLGDVGSGRRDKWSVFNCRRDSPSLHQCREQLLSARTFGP